MFVLFLYHSASSAACGMKADSVNPHLGQTSVEVKGICSVSTLRDLVPQRTITVLGVIYVMLVTWHVAFMSVPNFHVHSSNKRLKVTQ